VVRLTLTPGRDYEIQGDFYWHPFHTTAKPVKIHFAKDGQKVRLVLNDPKPPPKPRLP
jgi:hypothetical protein